MARISKNAGKAVTEAAMALETARSAAGHARTSLRHTKETVMDASARTKAAMKRATDRIRGRGKRRGAKIALAAGTTAAILAAGVMVARKRRAR